MGSLTQINDTQVSIINFKSIPVVTTAMLADFYGTEEVRIRQGHDRNKSRFIEGKHFFKLVGEELKEFASSLKILANFPVISSKTRSLILWTERGAARHAKILDTDQAWDVFEQLEDCYFHRQEILAKTHKSEREPLTNAVNMLVAKTKHLNYSDAYKLVHQRFNVKSIDEIPFDAIPIAVEYVHHLIALYSNADKKQQCQHNDTNIYAAAVHMLWVSAWWNQFESGIRQISPVMAAAVCDHFTDGSIAALSLIDKEKRPALMQRIKGYDWLLPYSQRSFNY